MATTNKPKTYIQKKEEKADEEHLHPFRDTGNRFAIDAELRKAGFRILSRKGEAIWSLSGSNYLQSEAVKMIKVNDLQNAEMVEKLYLDEVFSAPEVV